MSKNTISAFTLILLIGMVMWFFHMNHEVDETQVRPLDSVTTAEAAADTPVVETAVAPTTTAAVVSPTRRAPATSTMTPRASQISGELQTLEQQLANAQETLEIQRQNLTQLKTQAQTFSSRAPALDNSNFINTLRSEAAVQNGLMQMDSFRSIEEQINRQADDQIRAQSSAVEMQLRQMDQNIHAQQNLIQQTRENIVYWNQNFNNTTERLAQLQMLQDQLVAQQQQLDLMLQQRTLVSAEALNATQAIQMQKQEALAGLVADQQEARTEVESLRDSIIRLQQSQRALRSTQVSLSSQVNQAQGALQAQETQVKNLETAVQQKRQELESLVQ